VKASSERCESIVAKGVRGACRKAPDVSVEIIDAADAD
jgi:hypothetical protein